jgi:hypothetical protein
LIGLLTEAAACVDIGQVGRAVTFLANVTLIGFSGTPTQSRYL